MIICPLLFLLMPISEVRAQGIHKYQLGKASHRGPASQLRESRWLWVSADVHCRLARDCCP